MSASCQVYWGTHGCALQTGHDGPHRCDCCTCDDHASSPDPLPPYYGSDTVFYGRDA